jgi:hypothetical protein
LTGLHAVGFRKDGRPIWPIMGAADDDKDTGGADGGDDTDDTGSEGADDDKDTGGADGGDDTDTGGDDAGSDDLGDKGKQAIDRMKAREKAARAEARKAKQERDDAIAKLEAKDKPDDEQAIEAARREGESAATVKANARILRSEVKAAAAGKLADPNDALRMLDLDSFEVDTDGEVDVDEINDAIADLLEKKPYLAAQGRPKPKPDRNQGGRGGEGVSLDTQIAEAQKAGDYKKVIHLQNQKLVEQAK